MQHTLMHCFPGKVVVLGRRRRAIAILCALVSSVHVFAQSTPSSSAKPWASEAGRKFLSKPAAAAETKPNLETEKVYSLAELIDLAEEHNPDTRVAWQAAKMKAAELGVAKSAMYPAITAVALAATQRFGAFLGTWNLQTIGLFQPTLNFDYLIFDFGGRSGAINAARARLFASDFAFNDTHRKVIYGVTLSYYRLLNALGKQDAAKANLGNAQALEKDAEDRLEHGLATTPDVLEAKAGRAHAEYALANVIGEQEVAQGDLATALSLPARTIIQVQGLDKIATSHSLSVSADDFINRAFEQRPDLQEKVAQLKEAEGVLEEAHSAYLPTFSIGGAAAGKQRAYGQQNDLPGTYATAPHFWSVSLNLKWTIFDGGKRENELAAAKAGRKRAQAEIDAARDRISDEVWNAYSDTKTALRRQDAASAQLSAAGESYASALRAYDLGVRNLLDVLAAQRELAEARTEDITARTQVLSAEAALAFKTADLLASSAVIPIQQGVTH